MAREAQRGGEGGADAAGSHDADVQARGPVLRAAVARSMGWLVCVCVHGVMAFRLPFRSTTGTGRLSRPCYALRGRRKETKGSPFTGWLPFTGRGVKVTRGARFS
ncbi:hypothetical protein GCM10027091_68900 [Streptomyces daliensis]